MYMSKKNIYVSALVLYSLGWPPPVLAVRLMLAVVLVLVLAVLVLALVL